jgi:hypothetical protein
MPPRTQQALVLLGAAVALGLIGDAVVHLVPERLNVVLGLDALLLTVVALAQAGVIALPGSLAPLSAPLVLLGLALLWRDSPTLFALNLAGVVSVTALASPRLRAVGRRRAGLGDFAAGAVEVAGGAAAGAPALLFTDIDWATVPVDARARQARGAAIGMVAAVPVAAVFGGLLMQADPAFDQLMVRAFGFEPAPLVSHATTALLVAWLAAGVLRLLARPEQSRPRTPGRAGTLGLGEVGTVLLVVDLLFAAFVVVQFRYLFGGGELVRALTGLSYAEYARRGFFELVTVAALSLPLLLVADRWLDRSDPRRVRRFRQLAGVMLLLLDVMLASALLRMWLYTAQFGLTEQRLYTTAFMGWLVLVFGWFVATVLRGRQERFGLGALAAGWLVLGALNLLNPDRIIAEVNLARAARGRPLDVAYAATLSADALPAFHRGLPRLGTNEACQAAARLDQRWRPEFASSGRWTIALARAPRGAIGCGIDRPM